MTTGPSRSQSESGRHSGDSHPHEHSGNHEHEHDHEHDHEHGRAAGRALSLLLGHRHDLADRVDAPLESDRRGMRALWLSLAILGLTAALQGVVVMLSGSVALLGETFHNTVDALTALPLGLAFTVARRAPTRRYTYGFGRAEDLAGLVVLLTIALSTTVAAVESIIRLAHPAAVHGLLFVALAALVGLVGNETVASYRIAVGRRIGSAALVADGQHARTDGLSSVAVLLGVAGLALGWKRADAVAGLLIVIPIVTVLRSAAMETYRRLMDAVDPSLVDTVEEVLSSVPGVLAVGSVKLRWIGHELHAEAEITVDSELSVVSGHEIAERARHQLMHDVPRLFSASIHADPEQGPGTADPHDFVSHHVRPRHPGRKRVRS